MPRVFAPLIAAVAVVALAACSSSSTNSGPVQDPTFAAGSATTTPTAAAPTAISAGPVSVAPLGNAALPGVPAVTNATNLAIQPVTAAGTGTAPTGLITRDLVVGTGTTVDSTATVVLKYVGTLYANGTIFDASWGKAGETPANAASFPLNGVIPGFAQGLIGMKVGGRREIVIPPALGYGSTASGAIPANSTIVFVVDMVSTTG
jgi:hypothetical protein